MIIAVNEESAEIFKEFAKKNDNIYCVEHKAFIGLTEITEFMIDISPEFLAALSAYLIAQLQCKTEIRIKKGDMEIEIKDKNITPDMVLDILNKLEQKGRDNKCKMEYILSI